MPTKCGYCDTRKGNRECPFLADLICSKCCGEHRGVEISCPPDCRYFQKHENFQQNKHADSYRETLLSENEDLFEDENKELIRAIGVIETLLFKLYQEDTTITDSQIIGGLKGCENQLKTIELPGKPSEIADNIHKKITTLIEKGMFSRRKFRKATSRLLAVAEVFSDDSRKLVQGMMGRVKEDFDVPSEDSKQVEEPTESLITSPKEITWNK